MDRDTKVDSMKMNAVQTPGLSRSLTFLPLVFMGLAYMAPMAVFGPYGIVADMTSGSVAGAYLVALVMILFTAYSYGKMIKAFPYSGSAYTFTQKTMNAQLGFLVGWTVMMDYVFLPMLNHMAAAIFLSAAFPSIPIWIWFALFLVLVTTINIFGIQVNMRVNLLLVMFQVLVTVIFIGLALQHVTNGMGTGTLFSTMPIYNPEVSFSVLLAGASVVCTSFLGFDAVTTFTEETVEPRKTVPKAIYTVALIGGAIFISISYLMHMVYPDFQSFRLPDSAGFEVVESLGYAFFTSLFMAGAVISMFASALSAHASASRLLYAMGREAVLPSKIFGYVHPRFKTPVINVLIIGIICSTGVFIEYATMYSFINFGAIIAFTFVNLSVIFHYYVNLKQRSAKGFLLFLLIPAAGVFFNIWILANLDKHALLLGGIWIAAGFIYLMVLTKMFTRKPPQLHFDEIDRTDQTSEDNVIVS